MSHPVLTRVIAALAVALLWLASSYAALFETDKALLYNPETDAVYELTLTQMLYESNRWRLLKPFAKRHFTKVDEIEFTGFLSAMLAERAEFRTGLIANAESTLAKRMREFDSTLTVARIQSQTMTTGDHLATYVRSSAILHFRTDLPAVDLIPAAWRQSLRNGESGDLRSVDVTLVTRTMDQPGTTETMIGALLVRGVALQALISEGVIE